MYIKWFVELKTKQNKQINVVHNIHTYIKVCIKKKLRE